MKVAILSDVHANYAALKAVLAHLERRYVDGVWVLGDIIGRGCDPQKVAAEMRLLYDAQTPIHRQAWLSGNHERFVLSNSKLEDDENRLMTGFLDTQALLTASGDNRFAIQVALEHTKLLENAPDLLRWLASLPTYRNIYPDKGIHLVHAAMRFDSATGQMNVSETYNTYLWDASVIRIQFEEAARCSDRPVRLILGGHTHSSGLWSLHDGKLNEHKLSRSHIFDLNETMVYANPGSVGFPRIEDQCPTYMILNFDDSLTKLHIARHYVPYQPDMHDCWTTYPDIYRNEMQKCKS